MFRISWASARRSNCGNQENGHALEQQNDDAFNSAGSSKASVHVAFFTAKVYFNLSCFTFPSEVLIL
jgi:hypothetical protein